MKPLRILVVDDEPAALDALAGSLRREHEVEACGSGAEALARLERSAYDLLVTDLSMPPPDGFRLLRESSTLAPGMPVLVVTGLDTARAAMQALRLGARDLLLKPATDEEVRSAIGRLRDERDGREAHATEMGLIGHSSAIRRVRQFLPLLSRCREPVLVTGESGTGKSTLARAIHDGGARAAAPFVTLDLEALPPEHVANECFGEPRDGASASGGAFARARGGTLYFAAIHAFPLPLQARLLRVLEGRRGEPQDAGPAASDVRVIASTREDLGELVGRSRFRADLYFRLRQLEVEMPPLRERGEDAIELAERFLSEADPDAAGPRLLRTSAALLRSYRWPGNCRELKSAMLSAAALAQGRAIQPGHLPHALAGHGGAGGSLVTLAEAERVHIRRALEAAHGNRSHAARLLGIDRGTLARKLREMERGEPAS